MRHRQKGRKLGRDIKRRKALFKDLINDLILNEQIKTTEAKAKTIKGLVDKFMTKAKKGSLAHRRQVLAYLTDKKAVHKLFDVIAPRTQKRTSGFTRMVRIGQRRGDNTMMAKLEFVDKAKSPEPSKSKGSATPSKVKSSEPRKRSELKDIAKKVKKK